MFVIPIKLKINEQKSNNLNLLFLQHLNIITEENWESVRNPKKNLMTLMSSFEGPQGNTFLYTKVET